MITEPFSLFAPFRDRIRIDLLTKADQIDSDDAAAQAIGAKMWASAQQVHGNKTVMVDAAERRVPGVDGLITKLPNLTLLIRVADCQSFVAFDPVENIVGVLHAGWRGVVAGAIPAFCEALRKQGSDLANVLIGAGPSLCQRCAEFTDPIRELPNIDHRFFEGRHADLRGIADAQLREAGIAASHFERSPDCTKCRCDAYWSYRGGDREAVKAGFENVLCCSLR